MKLHLKNTFGLFASIFVVAFLLLAKVEASPKARFTQRIRPLPCVVTTLESGGITNINYSPSCGESVVPPPAPTPNFSTPSAPSNSGQAPPISNGGVPELITDNPAIYSPWGLTLIVKEGVQYYFHLENDNKSKQPRTLTVIELTEKGVVVSLEPGGITQGLVVGDKKELDLNGDGIVDMRLHLMAVEGHTGVLRVVLYHQISKEQTVIEKWYQQAIIGGSLVLLVAGVHFYHRRKIPHLHALWHAPHNYRIK